MKDTTKYLTLKDNNKIAYDVHGEGIPLLMIHGVTDCKETYDTDLKYLTQKFKVYRYDIRGHGRSSHPQKGFNLETYINDALEIIDKLSLNNFVLYGGSLGSYISEGVAVKIPQKLKALILNVSAAHNPASALAENSKKDKIPTNKTERRDYWIKKLVHDPQNYEKVKKSGFQKYSLNENDEYIALKSITAFDFTDELNKIKCPTAITSGKYDAVNPPQKGKLIANKIPNNQFIVFASGHLLRLEDPSVYWSKVLPIID